MNGKTVLVLGVAVVMSLLVPGPSLSASESERYWRTIEKICETGVTPDAVEAHRQFAAALDREATRSKVSVLGIRGKLLTREQLIRVAEGPHGRTNNFGGARTPDVAYANCFR